MAGTVKKIVELPKDEVQRFEERFPQHGAFTWFIREAIRRFNDIYEINSEELIELAVRDIEIKNS